MPLLSGAEVSVGACETMIEATTPGRFAKR
jgi:hypothetical protein